MPITVRVRVRVRVRVMARLGIELGLGPGLATRELHLKHGSACLCKYRTLPRIEFRVSVIVRIRVRRDVSFGVNDRGVEVSDGVYDFEEVPPE